MSKIIRLESTNYKRLKAVEIAPDPAGNLVIVAGKNGQGKTSILDSITAALGGVNAKTTPKPIRDGEDRAEIVLETEELTVTRKFTASGSTLIVKSPDGAVFPKGQAKLDDMLGKLSLDPLAFTQLADKEQLKTLLELVELPFDPTKLEAERSSVFAERTDVNRRVKELQGQAAGYTVPGGTPDEEVSVSALLTQYREAQGEHARRAQLAKERDAASEKIYQLQDRKDELLAELRRVDLGIEEAQQDYLQIQEALEQANLAGLPNLEAIQSQIDNAEQINGNVRMAKAHKQVKDQLANLQKDAASLTDQLTAIDKRKADGLAKATFPIDGLGFDDTGVTYQGVPFKQASGAEQLRVSLAMAIALNPKLRVIRIADGSLLDSDNLALVEAVAREHDFQVWIEMVGDGDGRGIVIEDGQLSN